MPALFTNRHLHRNVRVAVTMGGSTVDSSPRFMNKRKKPQHERSQSVTMPCPARGQETEEEAAYSSLSDSESERSFHGGLSHPPSEGERIPRPKGHKKSVSFSTVETRCYKMVIGDHPCCSNGCPVTLDWEYSAIPEIALDKYEAMREPSRRNREDLRTTWEKRQEILTGEGLSKQELRRAQRKLHRVRSCSAKLCERMSESFFHEELPSSLEACNSETDQTA